VKPSGKTGLVAGKIRLVRDESGFSLRLLREETDISGIFRNKVLLSGPHLWCNFIIACVAWLGASCSQYIHTYTHNILI
jgi:hypothetical protein